MEKNQLSTQRIQWHNPNHNLWLNNGTWWVKYVLHTPDGQKLLIRHSLHTHDVLVAREARDAEFDQYPHTHERPSNLVVFDPLGAVEHPKEWAIAC